MAVEPLYNESRDSLLSRVRVATADDEQTVSLVDQAIQEVRLGLFSRLGKERPKTIAGYAWSDNPDTDEEVLRVQAAAVEANWLTYLLAKRLPTLLMADEANTRDRWNEEPLTRDSAHVQQFLKDLKKEIDSGIGDLEDPQNANAGAVKSALNLPEDSYIIGENFKGMPGGINYPYG